ncbi:MAG: TRAP transporter small permease [Geminicoccaceae bacterium]|nr:MAG: TRAP transporter small permease [Geminicoccaceae bacterium]
MSDTASGTPWQRPAWLRAIRAIETTLTRTALALAMVGVLLMAGFTCYQVFMRFVIGQPSTWSEVLVRSIMVWTVYLAAAAAFREGAVIAAEVVIRAVPRIVGKIMQITSGLLSLVFLYFLVTTSIDMVQRTSTQVLAGLEIPIAWIYLAMPVGGTLAALAVAVRTSELLEPGSGIHDPNADSIA